MQVTLTIPKQPGGFKPPYKLKGFALPLILPVSVQFLGQSTTP
jgi:hypothetical protein